MRILIVDDEPAVCEDLSSKLRRCPLPEGSRICCAHSAGEAQMLFKEHPAELVFTDIRMPVVSGITLISRLRQEESRCVLIAVSGYDDFSYVRSAFIAGADDYILKPVSAFDLQEKLRAAQERLGIPCPDKPEPAPSPEQEDALLGGIRDYIALHYTHGLTLAQVADSMSISYSHFSRLFKEHMHTSFPAYLLQVRMEKAKQYLHDPAFPVGEIAAKVGYENANHFSRAFKKYTGMTPSEFQHGVGR